MKNLSICFLVNHIMLFLLILVYLYIDFDIKRGRDGWIVFYLILLPLSLISFILYELFSSNKHPFYCFCI